MSVAATRSQAMVIANTEHTFDESQCDPEHGCLGDYIGSENAPTASAWLVEHAPAAPNGFARVALPLPAHDLACGAVGCTSHEDFSIAFSQANQLRAFTASYGYSLDAATVSFSGNSTTPSHKVRLHAALAPNSQAFASPMPLTGILAADANTRVSVGAIAQVFFRHGPDRSDASVDDTDSMSLCGETVGVGLFVEHGTELNRYEVNPQVVPADCITNTRALGTVFVDAMDLAMIEDRGALVMRMANALYLQALSGQGVPQGTPRLLVRTASNDRPGAPSIAYDGTTLVVTYAQRATLLAPYIVHMIRVSEDPLIAPVLSPLVLTSTSAFAPSLAIRDGVYALAWMEGSQARARVIAGFSLINLEASVAAAVTVSQPSQVARDPELDLRGGDGWIVWSERPVRRESGPTNMRSRVAPIHCD